MLRVAEPTAGSQENAAGQKKTLRILLVEDNAIDARLLREMFSKEAAGSFELMHVTRMSEAEDRLAREKFDMLLLDMGLPDGQGIELLQRARKAAPDVVLIVITGLDDDLLAAEALREGAQDYLIKGEIENRALPRALRQAVERQRMQRETDEIRAHQLQLRDEFLSHVSHELRSPLTAIYSFTTIIADGLAGETTPQQQDYLGIISKNVRQLQSMIEDLLEVTQAQTGKLTVELQPVSVNEAMDYALHTLRGAALEKGITLDSPPRALLPQASADPTRLQQILTILVDNAVKFTPEGGSVHVQAGVYEKDAGLLLVEVSDTGCGIGADAAEHIFEHLYQVVGSGIDPGRAGRKGLGLGLHIAKELVIRLGGTIWVSSEPQKGSRFSFTLPIFSLAGWIGPILAHEKQPEESLAIITVEIDAQDGSAEIPRKASALARTILQQCLRPDTDVLLPNLGSTRKLSSVLACTQEHGAAIIEKRMLDQLCRNDELRLSGLTFAVSHGFLPAVAKGTNESEQMFVERVAAGIQKHLGMKEEAQPL